MEDTNKDAMDLETKTDKPVTTDEAHYANLFDRPEGLYLHGLDNMNTDDIHDYCADTNLIKVEWINDASCVLVYEDAAAAQMAAHTLLLENDNDDDLDSTELKAAKPYRRSQDDKALSVFDTLQLRMATDSDIKVRGARHHSRYYLFNGNPSEQKQASGSILDRLGARVPPRRYQESSRYDRASQRRRYDDDEPARRRSLSPGHTAPAELPDSLRGRLGNMN